MYILAGNRLAYMLGMSPWNSWRGKVPPNEAALRDKKVSSSGRWEIGTVEPMFFNSLRRLPGYTSWNIFWVVGSNIFLIYTRKLGEMIQFD